MQFKYADNDAGDPSGDTEAVNSDDQSTLQSMRVIYEQLASCFSSEQADEIAINFCFVQTKSAPVSLLCMSTAWSNSTPAILNALSYWARFSWQD